jgi:hypothetical protein
MNPTPKTKFSFDLNFQWSILKYTVQDKYGYKALTLYKEEYFDLNEHQVIAKALKRFYKKKSRVPSTLGLIEELRQLFKTKQYINAFTQVDKTNITKKAKSLYKGVVKDGDIILDGCMQFAAYVELKKELEKVDIEDFDQYSIFSRKIQKAINTGSELKEDKGTYIVTGVKDRQTKRRLHENIFPTPYWQMNNSTNGGGYTKGSVIVLIDKGKGGKTKALINVARCYLRMRKKVLYIDLENGEGAISDRIDQSVIRKTKREIISGEYDTILQKEYRKYKRLGGEIVVKRMPGLTTTANDIQTFMDNCYNELGLKFDELIIDYIANMGSTGGQTEDNARISIAYIDVKNLASNPKNNLESVWTGHHTTREAAKRRESRYEPNDTAKCIDVHRHIDAMWGINQSPQEAEAGIIRFELVDQRDGINEARVFFEDYPDIQRINEFNKAAVKEMQVEFKPKSTYKAVEKPSSKNDMEE